MDKKVINFIKNISYTVTSNLISLVVSTVVILIIPKLIGVEEYGYWQLYIFYSSYIGFLHFGWNDGIYLRYGGKDYESLDKKLFFSQFIELLVSQLIIGLMIWLISISFVEDNSRIFILQMVAISMVLSNVRIMFLYILQATNRIKEYARITMFDRIIYITLIIILLSVGIRNYRLMVIADIFAKTLSLLYSMICCKDIAFNRIGNFYCTLKEVVENINVGIKLMFANIASMLIIGIVRFGIERTWDVATFGEVSLTLSICNMMMIFINAVGIIMFPVLRKTSEDKLTGLYSTIRDFLMALLLAVLIMYYPLKLVIGAWLPQYEDSLFYMALIFPMFIYEGKMAILINTYLKTLRLEKLMLRINIISMIFSMILTYVSTRLFNNLDMAILSIVVLLIIRSGLAEIYLSRELNVKVRKDILLEILLTIVFILSGWFINSWMTMCIYVIGYFVYIIIKRRDIKKSINLVKLLIKG